MITRFRLVNLILPVLITTALVARQARDASSLPPTAATATLSGMVVIDDANATPVRRAVVELSVAGNSRDQWMTTTDDQGRFVFNGLPAGNLTLLAGKPGFVTTYYGARKPGATAGVPIALTAGQLVSNVTLKLVRGAVLAGTLFDEAGRPLPGVPVRVQQSVMSAFGGRNLTPVPGVLAQSTDDLGRYRIYGLPPGEYLVSAQPRFQGATELQQPTSAELRWAEQQTRPLAAANPAMASAPPAPSQPMTYAQVYYPGTADAGAATMIALTPGAEHTGLDMHMLFVPTARVDGTVVDEMGRPSAGVVVALLPKVASAQNQNTTDLGVLLAQAGVGLVAGSSTRTSADGSFSVRGVTPGEYALAASTTGRSTGPGRGPAAPATPALWASTDVSVSGQDLSGTTLRLAPGMTAVGRLVFQGRTPPQAGTPVTLSIGAASGGASIQGMVAVDLSNPVFAVAGLLPGLYRLTATTASWQLSSATFNGHDIADTPFEIRPGQDIAGIVVTFTDAAAEVSGVLYDAAKRPTADLSLLIFPTDEARWFRGSRWLRQPVRPSSDGRYAFANLLAGDYYVAALTDISPSDWFDPQFLAEVAPLAIRITLRPGEKRTEDIKVAK